MGPNVKKLIAARMALILIPNGSAEPFLVGVRALQDRDKIAAAWKEAAQWVEDAIAVVKTAPDNPYGDDSEEIAGVLVQKIDERRQALRQACELERWEAAGNKED